MRAQKALPQVGHKQSSLASMQALTQGHMVDKYQKKDLNLGILCSKASIFFHIPNFGSAAQFTKCLPCAEILWGYYDQHAQPHFVESRGSDK